MNLDDDCLFRVFSLLDFKDQLSAAQPCRRFQAVLSSMWQRSFKNLNFGMHRDITSEELAVLLESICETIQSLEKWTLEQLEIFRRYSFPALKELSLYVYFHKLTDDIILELTRMAPNLLSFCVIVSTPFLYSSDDVKISGRHIGNWQKLERLDLGACSDVEFVHLEKILDETDLRSIVLGKCDNGEWTSEQARKSFCKLERISLNGSKPAWLPTLSELSNLKELTIGGLKANVVLTELKKDLTENKRDDLVELHICQQFPFYGEDCKLYNNLKRVVCYFVDIFKYIFIYECTPNLREMFFTNCRLSHEDLSLLLNSNKSVVLLSLELCKCKFPEFHINVNDVVRNRASLLHFNFYGNRFRNLVVPLYWQEKSALLKISTHRINTESNKIRFRFRQTLPFSNR